MANKKLLFAVAQSAADIFYIFQTKIIRTNEEEEEEEEEEEKEEELYVI